MSEDSEYSINIISGSFMSSCPRQECGEPMTGSLNSEEMDDGVGLMLVCVSCGFKAGFSLNGVQLCLPADFEG